MITAEEVQTLTNAKTFIQLGRAGCDAVATVAVPREIVDSARRARSALEELYGHIAETVAAETQGFARD